MSRLLPFILLLALIGGVVFIIESWLAPARLVRSFQDEIAGGVLDQISGTVDIEQIRAAVTALAREKGVALERGTLKTVLGTPNLMSAAGLDAAKAEGYYPEKAIVVTARADAGNGFFRRTFPILAERGFAPGKSPRPVTISPKINKPVSVPPN